MRSCLAVSFFRYLLVLSHFHSSTVVKGAQKLKLCRRLSLHNFDHHVLE